MIIYATTRQKERPVLEGEEIKYMKMENNLLWK